MSAKSRDEHNRWRNITVGFRVAVIVVADNVPPLPAPVCALTDQSIACFSLLCQGFSSFPNRSSMKPPTMPPAASRISGVTCV